MSNNSIITLNENKIGTFKVNKNQSYAEIIIQSNNTKIPIDSKLQISDFSNFSELKNIKTKLIIGKSKVYVKVGDTLSWFISDKEKELEKTIMVGDFLFISKHKDLLKIKKK